MSKVRLARAGATILAVLVLVIAWLAWENRPLAQARLGERVLPFKRLTEFRAKPTPAPPASGGASKEPSPSFAKRSKETNCCPATRVCGGNNPVCKEMWDMVGYRIQSTNIPVRERELLTLRTAWLSRGEFVWASHWDTRSKDAGVTAEEVRRITRGPDAPGWSKFDATLLRAADELQAYRFITDETWKALGERYSDDQRFEVIQTCATYTTMSMYFNTTGGMMSPEWTGFAPFEK